MHKSKIPIIPLRDSIKSNLLNPYQWLQSWMIKRYLKRHKLPDLEHLTISYNKWTVAVWDKQDLHEVVNKPSSINDVVNKILSEINEKPKSTIRYKQFSEDWGMPSVVIPRNIQKELDNIVPTTGLQEMAKRSTGVVSTTNTHIAVGDDNTSAALADTALGNEIARKSIVSSGTRGVPSGTSTEQYGMPWLDSDFTVPETLDEAGLLTAGTGGVLGARVTFATKTIDTGEIMTTQINVAHQNGTET